jgi:hypothetical protein
LIGWPAGSGEKEEDSAYFYSFAIISSYTDLKFPLLQGWFGPKSGENWPSSFVEVENVKVYRQTDGQTEKLSWASSSGKPNNEKVVTL